MEAAVGIRGKNLKFHGFDGNNEPECMGIARFLVEQLGRFTDFKAEISTRTLRPWHGTCAWLAVSKTFVGT